MNSRTPLTSGGSDDEPDLAEGELVSTFAPRPQSAVNLPPARDHANLKLAAADMVELGLSFDEAAENYGVDPDTLHVFYRAQVNTVGKENLPNAEAEVTADLTVDFGRESSRQLDRNFAQRKLEAEQNRIPLSRSRQWLISFPLTRWMFNGENLDWITLTGVVCALVFGGLVLKSTLGAEGDATTETAESAEVAAPLSERQKMIARIPDMLEFIGMFIVLETWEERLPYVRNPEKVAPLMEEFYQNNPDGAIGAVSIRPDFSFFERSDGYFGLAVSMNTESAQSFLIEISDEEPKYLLDWKVLVNYEPVPLEKFAEARSTDPAHFRVMVGLGDYYNQPFMNEDEHICFKLVFYKRNEITWFGFAPRDSDLAKAIFDTIESEPEQRRAMVLSLRYPENAKFDNILEIDELVSDHW